MLGGGYAVGHHGVVIVGQRVFAEAAPAAGIRGIGEIEDQASDGALAGLEVADLGADGLDDSRGFVAQHERVVVHAGEMAGDQLAVGRVAQAGDLGPDQGLIGAGRGTAQLDNRDFSGFGDGNCPHGWLLCYLAGQAKLPHLAFWRGMP